jgi:hypothetical protein
VRDLLAEDFKSYDLEVEDLPDMWAPGEVTVDFGAGPVRVPRGLRVLDLHSPDMAIPAEGPVDWSQLDKLPKVTTVEWSGSDRGVAAAAAARRVRYLYWSAANGEIDLSGTSVTHVRLGGAGLRRILLPASIQRLQLNDPPLPELRVEAPDSGRGLQLQLFWRTANREQIRIPAGLNRITSLWLWPDREAMLSVVAGLADLQSLTVTFANAPGTVTDLSALRSLPALRTLQFDSAYDWDPDALPELPALQELVLHGTRRSTAAATKNRLKGRGVRVTISGTKTDTWLAAHLFNPFRDWIEESKAFGTAACKAYAKARTALDAAATAGPERSQAVEAALRGLVADLNAIDTRYELIDTINREHAAEVYLVLARHANVDVTMAARWLDEDREW